MENNSINTNAQHTAQNLNSAQDFNLPEGYQMPTTVEGACQGFCVNGSVGQYIGILSPKMIVN